MATFAWTLNSLWTSRPSDPADRSTPSRTCRHRGGSHPRRSWVIELARLWGVPEFVVAFFGASVGTSLPVLIVAHAALRRGESALGLAMGDALGSSFADAPLSVSMGPLLFRRVVKGDPALNVVLATVGAAVVVALLFSRGGEYGRRWGAILIVGYAASWPSLLRDARRHWRRTIPVNARTNRPAPLGMSGCHMLVVSKEAAPSASEMQPFAGLVCHAASRRP